MKGRTFEGRRELIEDYGRFVKEKDRDVRNMGRMGERGLLC